MEGMERFLRALGGLLEDLQYKSAAKFSSSAFAFGFKISHNQGGYSESSIATGSTLAFRKFSPFSGVPAGTEDKAMGESFFVALGFRPWPMGEMVIGVVNGWVASEVDSGAVVAGEEVEEELVR